MPTRNALQFPLLAALCLFFALGAALIARVPLSASPDEAAHWQYVQNIAQTGQLPIFRGAAPPAPGYEFHQPPLYYLLCAPGWKILGAGVQNYWCRVVSLGCGLVTIGLIWSAARLIFPEKPRIAALSALFAALFPLHLAVSAGSNNDGLAGTCAAALFLLIARMNLNGLARRDAALFGLVAGLAILTKNTLLPLVFAGFIALVSQSKKPNAQISMLPALGIASAICAVIGGPWLLRNQNLYGDILALGAFSKAANAAAAGFPLFSQMGMDFLSYARGLLTITFLTAWGYFGGPNSAVSATKPLSASGPHIAELWLLPLILVCLGAPLLAMWGWRRGREDSPENAAPQRRAVTIFWSMGVLLIVLAWAQFAYQFFAGAQARYLHPALLPFCLFLAVGWERLFRGRALWIANAIFGATLLILTLLNLSLWKTLV